MVWLDIELPELGSVSCVEAELLELDLVDLEEDEPPNESQKSVEGL